MRCIVISDAHGQPFLIENALKRANYDMDSDHLVFAGDLIDIGNEPGKCLEILLENKAEILCLSDDTEIFTKETGWTRYNDLVIGQTVFSYMENGKGVWNKIIKIQIRDYTGNMINIRSARGQDQLVTPDHYICNLSRDGKYVCYKHASDLAEKKVDVPIPVAAKIIQTCANISNEMIAICGLVVTEGTFQKEGGIQIYQYEDTSQPIRDVLNKETLKWSEYKGHSDRERVFYISKHDSDEIKQYIPNKLDISWFLNNLSYNQMLVLHEYLVYGDGSDRIGGGTFYTSNEQLADQFQLLSIFCGYRAWIVKRTRDIFGYKDKISYEVKYVKTHITHVHTTKFRLVPYDGIVFDITTKVGNFLARRNKKTFFTGNCGNHEVAYLLNKAIHPQTETGYFKAWHDYFDDNRKPFHTASCFDGIMITHAGISENFLKKCAPTATGIQGSFELAKNINRIPLEDLWYDDSPLWYRPSGHYNIAPDLVQVVGHTPICYVEKYYPETDLSKFFMIDPWVDKGFDENRFRYAVIENGNVKIVDSIKGVE